MPEAANAHHGNARFPNSKSKISFHRNSLTQNNEWKYLNFNIYHMIYITSMHKFKNIPKKKDSMPCDDLRCANQPTNTIAVV